ncbi:MAG: DUF885 domain-containing protein [Gammaproteobacteria bacterium]|nr:MAG: DUF885 domain-containing protein [Gammaproteobacteria bacterium]
MKVLPAAMLAVTLFVAACGNEPAEPPADVAGPTASLHALFDEFFERSLELNPIRASTIGDYRFNDQFANSIGPEHREASHELDEIFLARLLTIDRRQLSRQDRLSYDLFRFNREQSLDGERFPGHLQPMNQRLQTLNSFVQLGSGTSVHPFKTIKDYDDWLSRIDGFVVYVDQAIANMREGVRQGVVQPRILMAKALPQIESQIVDSAEDSGFWAPIENMPNEFSNEERERLTVAFKDAIENKVLPSYRRVANFVRDEYLAAARDTVGLHALPDGPEWYAYNVKRVTTTDLAPDEIHQLGLDEVARIHNEIRGVMTDVGFEGDLKDFFDYVNSDEQFYFDEAEELIQGYRDMFERISALSTKLFDVSPKGSLEVRRVEPFREASAGGASYRTGTPDGSRAGVFYANAYDIKSRPIWVMESLFLHEAIPGHHFQRSLQVENEDLPSFRRFGGSSAFTEGWGLYAETLGKELGVYTDPYQYFGALNGELWRAIRLVVDTGLHAKEWTRQDVLDFMYANSAVKEARAVSEADRVIAFPGQVLAYKIGQLKIRELRDDAEERLGDQFDVKTFHTQVLMDGPMPLSMLEDKIGDWVESQL